MADESKLHTDGDTEMENVNGSTEPGESTVATPNESAPQEEPEQLAPEELQRQLEERARGFLAKQLHRVIIPSYAAWFDREKVNELEKKSLPEFFNGKNRTKTPDVYKEYRDFMIDCYRLNPTEYLTLTACRRNLAGDVCTLMRVHAFLEKWGLINYQVDPETRPSLLAPQFTGHFQITLDTPTGLQPVAPAATETIEGKGVTTEKKKALTINGNEDNYPVSLELRKSIYDNSADASALLDENQKRVTALGTRQYNCYTCGEDVTKVRYHNLQTKQTIGALCFKHGMFPGNHQSSDYVKIDQAQQASTSWKDQEILLLLEGVEMYEDNWDAVAYHVGTRDKESCIIKFLQMPIEDPYLIKNAAARHQREKLYESGADSILDKLDQVKEKASGEVAETLSKRAGALAEGEDERQSRLVKSLVEAQLRKFELKLSKFQDLEAQLEAEKKEVEMARMQLYLDRLSLKSQAEEVLTKLREAVETQGEGAVELAAEAARIASKNPKTTLVQGDSDITNGIKAPKPGLKPISLDTPQTFKFWSA
ncbi:chromatin structure-remodeling complex protein Rsc8p [Trichomonascus vanleenenianus]|uniref:Rsc8p n=1 Tax=Trichomonascus vanleenenianus TaxID=2268995 RepID=UPI003ECA780D